MTSGHDPSSRRGLIALVAVLALLPVPAISLAQRATVAEGRITGIRDDGASAFFGIPYAAPPVEAGRWSAPHAPLPWRPAVRPADKLPASCPQRLTPDGFSMWTREYITPVEPGISEDCLFANVWTPLALGNAAPRARLPVLVFIHGGGYTSGSGTVPIYNGARLARRGLVVVTINYRLAALGFLAHAELSAAQGGASGNYAIQDQVEALRWVKRNIAAFGGDPARVTVSGQSAGAGSVLALLASPLAKGLFRGAIVQSAPAMSAFTPRMQAENAGAASLRAWGVQSIAAARALPLDRIMAAAGGGGPIADGHVVPVQPAPLASDVPVLVGYTLNDLFAQTRVLTAAQWREEAAQRYGERAAEFLRYYPGDTDAQASASATRESCDRSQMAPILEWQATRGARSPVYAYLFSHVEPGPESAKYGAFHSSELPYLFDTLHLSPGRDFTTVDREVVRQFSGAVENFVKTGRAGGSGLPRWPALDARGKAVMEFGDRTRLSRIYPTGADAVMAAGKPPGSSAPAAR